MNINMQLNTVQNISKRILVANRGEIAKRIAIACKKLGHTSIGLRVSFDPSPLYLDEFDEWITLEGQTLQKTFLNIDQIVQVCKRYNIHAVHPGYGFLSENSEFVRALNKENIIFIGPNEKAIYLMGDKAISKQVAKEAFVPVVPGSTSPIESLEEAKKLAETISYPVLLKAVAGGGGKGMRLCESEKDLEINFEVVQREANSSFGRPDLLLEKYIEDPHHIEVQVMSDKWGNYCHLFERECSVQRRYQKILEEAPSPFVGEDNVLREKLCNSALMLARKVGYDSAGTVEFIVGKDRHFYFLEMNTRIQVEHPITEEATGVDIVEEMINVALGQPLSFKQTDIVLNRHAIEVRLCAEDPETFIPAPGFVESVHFPSFPRVRIDHCLEKGLEITPNFDSMLAKIIVSDRNRMQALSLLEIVLKEVKVYGLKTNLSFLKKILKHPQILQGEYSTHFISNLKKTLEKNSSGASLLPSFREDKILEDLLDQIPLFLETVHENLF